MSVQSELDRINQNVANTYAVLSALGADMPTEQNSDNLAATAGSAKVVLYKAQTLTDAQKAQARANIGMDNLSLGIASDGLIYLFVGGKPVGTGIPQGASGDVFGYVDENNTIVLTGSLADGTYSIKYEMEDGSTVDIGDLVLDNNVYYSITRELLANCEMDDYTNQIISGESYTAVITALDGYELSSVVVTMGGEDVTASVYSDGVISIDSVTGDIVITAVAEASESTPAYTNLLPLAVDADGNDYVGTNGEDGYKSGYKISCSSGNESATSGAYCSGFMPISGIRDVIRVKNVTLSSAANVNNFVFYDATKAKVGTNTSNGTAGAFHVSVADDGNGVYRVTPSSYLSESMSVAFFRFSCGGITDETIVTVNEEIV